MTELLLKLLGTPMDDALAISKTSLAFRGGVPLPWIIFGALVLGILTWWSYAWTPQTISRPRKYLLTSLRLVFFLLVLGLLLRPILALTVEGSIRRSLVMLIDESSSMNIKDPRVDAADQKRAALARNILEPDKGLGQPLNAVRAREVEQMARVEVVRSAMKNPRLNLLPRLEKNFDLDPFTFGQGVAQLSRPETKTNESRKIDDYTWVDKLAPASPLTPIGDSLREVINRKRGQPLAGIVLVTDGANNSGSQPRDAAAQLRSEGVPLYIYGVGITSPRDIIVANLFAPDVTFVKDEVSVTVRVRSQGLSGQSAKVKLQLDSTTVAEKEILFGADGEQVVALNFTPQNQGQFELTASIDPREDETVKENNSATHSIRVVDSKIRILLADQSPRWEFRYLQAMLLRDRRVDLKCFLVESDPAIARGTNTPYMDHFPARQEEIAKYDLVIFGDIDPRKLHPWPVGDGQLFRVRVGWFVCASRRQKVCAPRLPTHRPRQDVAGGVRRRDRHGNRSGGGQAHPPGTHRGGPRQPDDATLRPRRRERGDLETIAARSIGSQKFPVPSPPPKCCWSIPIPARNRVSERCRSSRCNNMARDR